MLQLHRFTIIAGLSVALTSVADTSHAASDVECRTRASSHWTTSGQ